MVGLRTKDKAKSIWIGYNLVMVRSSQQRLVWATLVVYFMLITLPYVFAAIQSDQKLVFGGFLLNPIDGNSYLAKMYQGWRGDTQFQLPYTATEGNGAYLFLFYLFLGHVSRFFYLDNIITFHIFRLVGAIFLGWVFIKKLVTVFPDESLKFPLSFVGLIGLGSGWLVFLTGQLPPDTWIAEAYPFLAGYANPHFPLGLGLMILLLFPGDQVTWKTMILNVMIAILLAIILPFGSILVLGVWFLQAVIAGILTKEWHRFRSMVLYGLVLSIASGPILFYDFWVTRVDPLLNGWDSQNLTPSPSIVLVLIGLLPVCAFSLVHIKPKTMIEAGTSRIMLVWLIVGLVLLYAPIGLQRRMMTGIFIPAVWLGFYGIAQIRSDRLKKNVSTLVIGLSMITPLIVLMAGMAGSWEQAPEIFLWRDEFSAFDWIEENSPGDALVLTGPETGLFIPAYTGRKVYYGHPFETVDAETQKNWVTDQLEKISVGDVSNLPAEIDLIFWGPRETIRFGTISNNLLPVLFQNNLVTVYSLDKGSK